MTNMVILVLQKDRKNPHPDLILNIELAHLFGEPAPFYSLDINSPTVTNL